jgi:hypothetical protein
LWDERIGKEGRAKRNKKSNRGGKTENKAGKEESTERDRRIKKKREAETGRILMAERDRDTKSQKKDYQRKRNGKGGRPQRQR